MKVIIAILATLISSVYGHGALTSPQVRRMTSEFYQLIPPAMRSLSEYELQRYPLEYVSRQIGQAAAIQYPQAYSLPCRGVPFLGLDVHTFTAGQTVPFSWRVDAPHQGTCSIQLFVGNVRTTLASVPCAGQNGPNGVNVKIPNDLNPICSQPGKCFFQFFWDHTVNDESYANCVDFVIRSNGSQSTTFLSTASTTTAAATSTTVMAGPPSSRTRRRPKPTTTTTVTQATTAVSTPCATTTTVPVKTTTTSVASTTTTAPGNEEAECTHGNQKCCGTPQQFCTCLFGKWDVPRTLVVSNNFICRQNGDHVLIVAASK